jgi:hypothetical protein
MGRQRTRMLPSHSFQWVGLTAKCLCERHNKCVLVRPLRRGWPVLQCYQVRCVKRIDLGYRETVAINERRLSIPSPMESARASPARPLGIPLRQEADSGPCAALRFRRPRERRRSRSRADRVRKRRAPRLSSQSPSSQPSSVHAPAMRRRAHSDVGAAPERGRHGVDSVTQECDIRWRVELAGHARVHLYREEAGRVARTNDCRGALGQPTFNRFSGDTL